MLGQGFRKCGTRTIGGTPASVQWFTGLVRKYQRIKNKNCSFNKFSYIEKLIKLFLFYLNADT
jgi:hypothetical protein